MATPEVEVLVRTFQTKSQILHLEEKTRSFVQTFIEDKSQLYSQRMYKTLMPRLSDS